MRYCLSLGLLALWCGIAPGQTVVPADAEAAEDEQTLRAAGIGVDGPALLEFFRKRTLPAAEQEKLEEAVRRLGARRYPVRRKATADLLRAGQRALPFLTAAVKGADAEVARLARQCLSRIVAGPETTHAAAAARLVTRRKPVGAAGVLLGYCPFAGNEDVAEEVQAALNALALADGKPDADLVKGLKDTQPRKRAAAAEALIRAGPPARRDSLHTLLSDGDALVRLRAAQAFLAVKDREAVPVLAALVSELPGYLAPQAEEALYRLAGDTAPARNREGTTSAADRSVAWAAWWKKHADTVDLTRVDTATRLLGRTVVVLNRTQGGRVAELGADGKSRWQIGGLKGPRDVQVLSPNRVLIAEEDIAGGVTERTRKGTIVWQKLVGGAIACQRLPNGNTFIGTRTRMLVVDRSGKEVFSYAAAQGRLFATGVALPGGEIGVVMSDFVTFKRFDSSGKELKSTRVDFYSIVGNIDGLPGGRLLVPEYDRNRVAEYDRDGKRLRQWPVRAPTGVVRLPSGNLLVSSWTRQWMAEIDRGGKIVREYKLDGRPCRVRLR